MNKTSIFLIGLLLFSATCWAQIQPTMEVLSTNTRNSNPNAFADFIIEHGYLDVNLGAYPQFSGFIWQGQLGLGYRFNGKTAIGIGTTTWGRRETFSTSAWGIGGQFRQKMWRRLVGKAEGGYILHRGIYDRNMHRDMVYQTDNSKPFYAKLELHWQFSNGIMLGIAATQSTNLYFKRYFSAQNEEWSLDRWRINSFAIQIGFSLDEIE